MQYPSKKQSWLEFINQSMDNHIKSEVLDRPMNGMNHNNYYHHHHHHHQMAHPNLVQQQDDLENRK
jgi:hypothetical protein